MEKIRAVWWLEEGKFYSHLQKWQVGEPRKLPATLTSVPGKIMEQVILEIIKKYKEDKKVLRNTGVVRMNSQGEIMLD